jgi:uncharacterized YccA/Bax inhibitor family protein
MRDSGYYSYVKTNEAYLDQENRATYKGIAIKTIFLLAIAIAVAVGTMFYLPSILENNPSGFYTLLTVSVIVGFVCALVGRLSDRAAMVCSFIYSLCEGLFLGVITALVNSFFPGAGTLAVTATLVVFTIMLVLYSLGFFRKIGLLYTILLGLLFATIGLVGFDFLYVLINGASVSYIYFIIQGALLIYGVITLAFNFEEAESVVKLGINKGAEWSVALGIEISLIYIYIYILRIILLFSRNN